MRFDQLPSELLFKIAKQSDAITRGNVKLTCKRTYDIFGRFAHVHRTIERIELNFEERVVVTLLVGPCPLKFELPATHPQNIAYLNEVHNVGEIVFCDIHFEKVSIEKTMSYFPNLIEVPKLSFVNCPTTFDGDFLTTMVEQYSIKNIKGVCLSKFQRAVQSIINDKFLSTFYGDFQFTVGEKTSVAHMKTELTDASLWQLIETPKKVFKLENIRCDFTPQCLVNVIKTTVCSKFEIEWNLGVIVVPSETFDLINEEVRQALSDTAQSVNGYSDSNWSFVGETAFIDYMIQSADSLIQFAVQQG